MATEEQAIRTYDLTRAFYKRQAKSSNKAYFATGKFTSKSIGLDKGTTLDGDQQTRNDMTLQNIKDMLKQNRSTSSHAGKTPFEIGEALYKQGVTLGNCGEMAAVAIYLAITVVLVPAGDVSMWQFTKTKKGKSIVSSDKTFGHSLAVLGKGKLTERWAVDPWAGEVCSASEYSEHLSEKMKQWTAEGKRIAAGGNWVEPTNDLVSGVLSGKFSEFEANQKGA
jgi:hypothetical protein